MNKWRRVQRHVVVRDACMSMAAELIHRGGVEELHG